MKCFLSCLGGFLYVILCFDFFTLLNDSPVFNPMDQSMSFLIDKNCLLENVGVAHVFPVLLYETDGLKHKFGFLSLITKISQRLSSLFHAT